MVQDDEILHSSLITSNLQVAKKKFKKGRVFVGPILFRDIHSLKLAGRP